MTACDPAHIHIPAGETLGRMPPELWAVTWFDTPIGAARKKRYTMTFHRKADAKRLAERCGKMKMNVEVKRARLDWKEEET